MRSRRFHPRAEELEPRTVPSTLGGLDFQVEPADRPGPASGNTQIVGDTPAQVRHAYGFDQVAFLSGQSPNSAGAGQTIAIVDVYDDPNILSDANFFSAAFGLPKFNSGAGSPTFTKVNENGSAAGPFPGSNSSWAAEISLDVEWAHAIAPAANVVLVEANSTYIRDLIPAIDTARDWSGVSTVSMSWGGAEFSGISAYDSHLTTPSGDPNGVTFTAATLDNGAYYTGRIAAFWPAVSPNALAVGGTVLTLDSGGNYAAESGWSSGGGGLSKYEAQPSYQSDVVKQSTTQRANPDVAYAAGGPGFAIYDTVPYNRQVGWLAAQGTSAGTPQWAALVAIANQGRAQAGLPALDGPSQVLPTLYSLYASSSYSADFHDVMTGSNGNAAGTGYDLVTGLGTPQAAAIIQALLGVPAYAGGSSAAARTSSTGSGTSSASAALTLPLLSGAPSSLTAPPAVSPTVSALAVPAAIVSAPAPAPATGSTAGRGLADLVGGSGRRTDDDGNADGTDATD